MSGFLTQLRLEYIDGRCWQVLEPFEYFLGAPDGTDRVVIPAGFVTDFASIPRALWNVLPPTGGYGKAAVVHDFLYQYREVQTTATVEKHRYVDRAEADHILREGMEVLGVSPAIRWVIYSGVRFGGWMPWRRYRSEE